MNTKTRWWAWLLCVCIAPAILTGCFDAQVGFSRVDGGFLNSVTNLTRQGVIPADIQFLEVENRFGRIDIAPAEDGAGEWVWTLRVRGRTDESLQEATAAARCDLKRSGNGYRLAVSLPNSSGDRSYQSDLQIRISKSAAARTQNRFGATTITGLENDVEATNQNGSVTLSDIHGTVRAETSFADLTIEKTGPARLQNRNGKIEATEVNGALEARTTFASLIAKRIAGLAKLHNQNGAVTAMGVKGDAEISTTFDALTARRIEGTAILSNHNGRIDGREIAGSVTAKTSFAGLEIESAGRDLVLQNQNGSVRVTATGVDLERLKAQTTFASLEVRLPAELKPAIVARTSFGRVESDFPILMPPRGQDPFTEATGGTSRVTLHNHNGNIRVVRQRAR